jgi:hypothetical protein
MSMPSIRTGEWSREGTMPEIPDDESWAVTEFADAELGDARRTQRLVELATVLAQRPSTSLPEACGTPAMLKAAYRFFDNAAIDPQEILASHVVATSNRLAAVPVVLAVQDTTELDWTAHPATSGLGPLAHPAHQGLLVHTTLALTPARLPLGLLAQQVWARDPADIGKRTTRKRRPLAEKESQKWLTSVDAVIEMRTRCPQTQLVCIGDREADVYDLLVQERPSGHRWWPRSRSVCPGMACSRPAKPRSACGGAWCWCVRPGIAPPRSCRRSRSGPSRPWRNSHRPGVSRSSGCC